MDLGMISAALSSVKTATDLAKLLKESGATLEKAEVKLQLAELISALADVKMQMADVQQALLDKDDQIRKLKQAAEQKAEMLWEAPYYWRKVESGKDGPYCQQCFDKNGSLIRLIESRTGFWTCRTCQNSYRDATYKKPEVRRQQSSWMAR